MFEECVEKKLNRYFKEEKCQVVSYVLSVGIICTLVEGIVILSLNV